jgi:hypothetical protein
MMSLMNPSPAVSTTPERSREIELRGAVRFPLSMPVIVYTEGGEVAAMTVNISASGILFHLAQTLPLRSIVSFTIKMPAEAMGTASDVVVHCAGRIVRSGRNESGAYAAAVIDKYYFRH